MSYTGPEFETPQPRRPRRGPLTVALAALVPGALLGWVVYEAVGGGGSDHAASAGSTSGTSAASSSHSSPSTGSASPSGSGGASAGDGKDAAGGSGPLAGKVVVIDPGHNQGNFQHATEINQQVDIGTNRKECDTTGTSTDAGYTEARFTLDVAHRLRALLEKQGATVKMTRDGDSPAWGPCVDQRAHIGNTAHADAAISIHADGAGSSDHGFHVIMPQAVDAGGVNNTATNHDRISAMPTTWKIEIVYSPALDFANPTGRKPAAVISVPVSIGNAVAV